jgi:uncharacterized membrane protein YqiK
MVKYIFDNSENSENSFLIIIFVISFVFILLILILFIVRKYYIKKKNKINFNSKGAEPILDNEM